MRYLWSRQSYNYHKSNKDFQEHSFLPGCHPNKCPSHSGVIETGRSDHCLIYAVLNTKLIRPKNDIITRRSFKNYDQDAFLPEHSAFLGRIHFWRPWRCLLGWEKLYNRVVDDYAPVIEIYFYLSSDSFVLFGGNILHNPRINCLKSWVRLWLFWGKSGANEQLIKMRGDYVLIHKGEKSLIPLVY